MNNMLRILFFLILSGCCLPDPDFVCFSVYNDRNKLSKISFSVDGLSVEDLLIEPHAVVYFELDSSRGWCFGGRKKRFEKVVINGKKIGNLRHSNQIIYSPMISYYVISGDSVFLREMDYSDYGMDGDEFLGDMALYNFSRNKPKFGKYKILFEYR